MSAPPIPDIESIPDLAGVAIMLVAAILAVTTAIIG